jgi:polyisoprenoid-binding protein YceI
MTIRQGGIVQKIIASLAFMAIPLAANADNYTVDPLHASVNFSIEHLGLSNIYGRFDKFQGKFVLDRAARTGSVEYVIDTASVDTNDNDKGSRPRSRDEHLRSADFFNVAEFPKMTYKSSKVTWNGDNPGTIEGALTLLGATQPVNFTVEKFKCNPPSATSKERCGGVVVGKLKRSDFGMKRGIPSIGDEITLVISFEADKDQ